MTYIVQKKTIRKKVFRFRPQPAPMAVGRLESREVPAIAGPAAGAVESEGANAEEQIESVEEASAEEVPTEKMIRATTMSSMTSSLSSSSSSTSSSRNATRIRIRVSGNDLTVFLVQGKFQQFS